jgi:NTP pyrophosphatase (non-canonical NTP hydrolase)
MAEKSFQRQVSEWLSACFPPSVCIAREERMHRFLEEALELAQAIGCSNEDAHKLVDYVFSREVGRPELEVGGVMVTLAALCSAADIDMNCAAERELERNWLRIDAIRRKQTCKPLGTPLPQ